MDFNPQMQLAGLLEWMAEQMAACRGKTAVIGISGGKDSSTVAALAVAAYAESLMPGWGGVGRYPVKAGRAKGWVHVDTRPNKSRWTL